MQTRIRDVAADDGTFDANRFDWESALRIMTEQKLSNDTHRFLNKGAMNSGHSGGVLLHHQQQHLPRTVGHDQMEHSLTFHIDLLALGGSTFVVIVMTVKHPLLQEATRNMMEHGRESV